MPEHKHTISSGFSGALEGKDLGAFLIWGIPLMMVPLLGIVVHVLFVVIFFKESMELQHSGRNERSKPCHYTAVHPVLMVCMLFILLPVFHPLMMHWRNQCGAFKAQPHAVALSIVFWVLVLTVSAVRLRGYFAAIFAVIGGQ
ncbi:MAG: hypothetical protein AAF571_02730 [Verrucomicrobiota bacterium]